jgi:alpha-amylase
MQKALWSIGFALLLVASPARAQQDVNGVMLQGWYWDQPHRSPWTQGNEQWWETLARMMPLLREWGFTGLWIPPPCKAAGGGFSTGYDMYDPYDLGSKDQCGTVPTKWGNKENLLRMVSLAHANGIDVYADIVVNHRAGGAQGGYVYRPVGSEGPGRFPMASWDFHHGGQGDWDMDVAGQRDMAQETAYVRDNLFRWIRWFDKQTGVDGYRIDAVKHMPPGFTEGLLYQVQEGMGQRRFAVGEFYDGNPSTLGWWTNAVNRRSGVFDFTGFFELLSMAHGNGYYDMRRLRNRFYDDQRSVTFCNNHDTHRRANGLHLFMRSNLAHAFMMAASGYPSVYWLDLFDDNGSVREWMLNLVWIHHMFARGAQLERWADDDLYVLEREGNLLAGFNDNTQTWRTEWVRTGFGANVRLHDYALGVGDVWTNQDGWARISVPPSGYVMYARDGSQGRRPATPARRTRQEWEAAPDMDTRPAGEFWSDPIRIQSAAHRPIWVSVWLDDKAVDAHVAIFDKDGRRLNHARGRGHVYFPVSDPAQDGWYQVRIGLEQTGQSARSNYHLQLDYQAPRSDQGPAPATQTWQTLPLVSTSTGP